MNEKDIIIRWGGDWGLGLRLGRAVARMTLGLDVSRTRAEIAAAATFFHGNPTLLNVVKGAAAASFPPPAPKSIRLFLLSGLTDFEDERNMFWEDVLPELQQFCLQHGADLSVIDPYLGSKVELGAQPLLLQTLLDEMEEAKSEASGVFFLGLIGDKYGPSRLPLTLSTEEFKYIRQAAVEAGKDGRTLDEHYRLDANSEVPSYTFSPGKTRRLDEKTRLLLQEALQKGAHQAHADGNINMVNASLQNRLFVSVVEELISSAIRTKDSAARSLVLQRRFQGGWAKSPGKGKNGSSKTSQGVSLVLDTGEEDPSGVVGAEARLASLQNHVSASLGAPNIEVAMVPLSGLSCGPDYPAWRLSKEHERYVEGLGRALGRKLRDLFAPQLKGWRTQLKALQATPNARATLEGLFKEWQTHLYSLVQRQRKPFVGQKSVLGALKDHVKDAQKKRGAFVLVQGPACSGKTTVLAEMAVQLRGWLSSASSVVLAPRLVAHTPAALHSHQIFQSLAAQITVAYQLEGANNIREEKDSLSVNSWLSKCFEKVSASKIPLVILLDDIHLIKHDVGGRNSNDTNSMENASYYLSLSNLPSGVIVIGSSLAATADLAFHALTGKLASILFETNLGLKSLKPRKRENKMTVTLQSHSESELLDIFRNHLASKRRKVSGEQEAWVRQRLKDSGSPFVSQMLAVEAVGWGSNFSMASGRPQTGAPIEAKGKPMTTKHSLISLVDAKLQQMEKEFGSEKVSTLVRYVECSNYGLCESELLDALSANRGLHQRLARDAPSSRVVRFPPRLWLGIKRALGALLERRVFDDRVVYWWSHQVVSSAVRARYLTSTAQIKLCQKDLADLFLDYWTELGGFSIHTDMPSSREAKTQRPTLHDGKAQTNGQSNGKRVTLAREMSERPPSAPLTDRGLPNRSQSSMQLTLLQTFPQPLKYVSGEEPLFNVRRLRNLWYHLLHSGSIEGLKENAICNFAYLDGVLQSCGLSHLLSIFLDIHQQVLNHDVLAVLEQVLVPSILTLREDRDQLAAEFICRLRYTREENSGFLNRMVEQAMVWVDSYTHGALLVPLTYWLPPPRSPLALSFSLREFLSATSATVVEPTLNHQHLLLAGTPASPNSEAKGLILMYHIASNTLVRTFKGHLDTVTALVLSKSGQSFYSASWDGTVRLWDLMDGRLIKTHMPHSQPILCAVLTKDEDLLITGSADSCAKVTRLEGEWKVSRTFPEHSGAVGAVALTAHSEFLITGSGDFVVRVWDMASGALLTRLGSLMAPVACLTLTGNDAFVIVACEDETLRVFSLVSGTELHELRGHESKVLSLATAANDCQMFAGCLDGRVYSYDLHTADIIEIFDCAPTANTKAKTKKAFTNSVNTIKVTKDNWFLISGAGDMIHVWNLEQNPDTARSKSHNQHHDSGSLGAALSSIAMSRDFKYTSCGTANGAVALWDLDVVQCVWTSVHEPPEPVTVVTFAQDATVVLSGTSDAQVAIWSMGNGTLLRHFRGHKGSMANLSMSADKTRVISHDATGFVCIWGLNPPDEADYEVIATFQGPKEFLVVSPGDTELLAKNGDNPKELGLYKIQEEGMSIQARMPHSDEITCMAVNRSGSLVVSGSKDQSLKVWNAQTGYITQVLVGHEGAVRCCGIADDARTVVSAAADRIVFVWEIHNGSALRTFTAHKYSRAENQITAVSICSDASVALSADSSGWMYAWSVEKGTLLTRFNAHMPILQLIASPDANRVVLRLRQCPHLPILCLHNSPAGILQAGSGEARLNRRRASQASVSSFGSSMSGASGGPTVATMGSPVVAKEGRRGKDATVFDRLERNRSRISIIDSKEEKSPRIAMPNSTSSSGGKAGKSGIILEPSAKSKLCTIL